ncbi:MAG TPA: SigB/SigF/SigG family RNA polymerase sigma factor [Acidimicrobiia bacterium]|jgi:RNA polymerase sigma-B factor
MSSLPSDATELFRRYRGTRDRTARDELVATYLSLARSLAARYRHKGEPIDDLEQVATLGLIKAIDRFDPDRGVAFVGFATPTILGELKRHFRDHAWSVRVPRTTKEQVAQLRRAVDERSHALGRAPTIEELAIAMGVDTEEVLEAIEAGRAFAPDPLEAHTEPRDERTDDGTSHVDDRVDVERILAELPDDERLAVELRFFDELTQTQIAERLGVSQMQVSRLLRRALVRLRPERVVRG